MLKDSVRACASCGKHFLPFRAQQLCGDCYSARELRDTDFLSY